MKTIKTILNVLIILLIFFQLVLYSVAFNGNYHPSEIYKRQLEQRRGGEIAYFFVHYFGLNFYLILAIILFFFSWKIKRKLIKNKLNNIDMIDSIGKHIK